MLKISGVILCIAGCAGYGLMKIAEWKRHLAKLNQWLMIVQKIKSRLIYQKETLEESCIKIGEREEGELGPVLKQIGEKARLNRQMEFSGIWWEELDAWCRQHMIHKKVKELFLQFPEYAKGADSDLQTNLLSLYLEELQQEKRNLENQLQEKQKPVMAISLISGVMISILLV